jgi:hypothetical protein
MAAKRGRPQSVHFRLIQPQPLHQPRHSKRFMVVIEQAIFTSAQTARGDGYQLVAHSPGLSMPDARQLTAWGPSHDSLLESGDEPASVNFWRLTSGNYCVSRTTSAGHEYSARGGTKVYTQFLVIAPDEFARFANHPFAVLNAAFAQGSLRVHETLPDRLEPICLAGRAAAVEVAEIERLAADLGLSRLQAILAAALGGESLLLVGAASQPRLLAGLLHCLPPECRGEVSFSTGLKLSARRPNRITCLGDEPDLARRLARRPGTLVLDLSREPPPTALSAGWAALVAGCITAGRVEYLARQLATPRPGLALADLPSLAEKLGREMAQPDEWVAPHDETPAGAAPPGGDTEEQRRADAAHPRFHRGGQATCAAGTTVLASDPSQSIGAQCPEAIETLELLDDTVFEAIAAKPGAIDELKHLWPQVLSRVGPSLLEESREQYLRHALRVWKECIEGDQIHNPVVALAALEVISLLLGEGELPVETRPPRRPR